MHCFIEITPVIFILIKNNFYQKINSILNFLKKASLQAAYYAAKNFTPKILQQNFFAKIQGSQIM